MNIELVTTEVTIRSSARNDSVVVALADIDGDELLEYVRIEEAIKYYTEEQLLDHIGKDKAQDYFDLKSNED